MPDTEKQVKFKYEVAVTADVTGCATMYDSKILTIEAEEQAKERLEKIFKLIEEMEANHGS